MPAARRPLNPALWQRVGDCGQRKTVLALAAGFSHYPEFYVKLQSAVVSATPLLVSRLERLADAVGFPREQIFLDEAGQ